MQSIQLYIAFLLALHDRLIVPGLGAFIVSPTDNEKANRWGIISPPKNSLAFNPEIKHEDNLLADFVAKDKKCSPTEANLLINQYVTHVLLSFDEGKEVKIPGVGILYSKDNKRLFQPDKTLSCNAINYGLTGFSLPYLEDLQTQPFVLPENDDDEIELNRSKRKSISFYVVIALALLAMCIVPTSLNKGGFFSERTPIDAVVIDRSIQNKADEEGVAMESENNMQENSTLVADTEIEIQQPRKITIVRAPVLHYYVIIASYPDQSFAKKTLSELQSKGFVNAGIISTEEQYRVYANHFKDKTEATQYHSQFRQDYPEYSNALLQSSLPPNQSE